MSSNIIELTRAINKALDLPVESATLQERRDLLKATQKLNDKLEGPEVGIWKVIFGPQSHAALRTGFEMELFEKFQPNIEQIHAQELAERLGVEQLLLVRIMRGLTASGIFEEIAEETYAHNARSKRLTNPTLRTMLRGLAGTFSPYMIKMPEYLASISFQNPDLAQKNLFQYSMQTEMNYFDWLHTQPKELEVFSAAMAASSAFQQSAIVNKLSDAFPSGDLTSPNASAGDNSEIIIVDVGGGRGEILNGLRRARADLTGAMIVQDLPKEIEGRESAGGIQSMAHDFFTPQPIKGAHTYFFRHILHDWPDSACRSILQHTVSAMKKGHSRLLIMDTVLPDVGASLFGALLDVNMMAISGTERTEKNWRSLLEREGLVVVRVVMPEGGRGDGLIEAVLG